MNLVFEIHLHQPRWHGAGEWPPSPLRLYQALLAGACLGRAAPTPAAAGALEQLAQLDPPTIAVPPAVRGARLAVWVASNDLDAIGGDASRIAEIRQDKKIVQPQIFSGDATFLFAWKAKGDAAALAPLAQLAESLYQFGRGVDMAYANALLLSDTELAARIAALRALVWRPAPGERDLRCPTPQTLPSLLSRHREMPHRLRGGLLSQPAPPEFLPVRYGHQIEFDLFELQRRAGSGGFEPWPLEAAVRLATRLRNAAAQRLAGADAALARTAEQVLVGHGAGEADKARRLQIVPLPSIGSRHTDPAVRRILVRRPTGCPISSADARWAFSGLDLDVDYATGEIGGAGDAAILTPAEDDSMLQHYGMRAPARVWQSVTAVALPVRRAAQRAGASARIAVESEAAAALRQALRHAGIGEPVAAVQVQKEPFAAKGIRAEAFAAPPRFEPARLWHCEITFLAPVYGPLIIGDGRYLGLGLLAPAPQQERDALVFALEGRNRPPVRQSETVVRSVRRALMALARGALGAVPTLISGHRDGPGPAQAGQHRHIYCLAYDADGDGLIDQVIVIAPWRVDRSWEPRGGDIRAFEKVVSRLATVRAGAAGVLGLAPPAQPGDAHPLFAASTTWLSASAYHPTAHRSNATQATAAADLEMECARRHLPPPKVQIVAAAEDGSVRAQLDFPRPVAGPILLGRSAHRGGGLFLPALRAQVEAAGRR